MNLWKTEWKYFSYPLRFTKKLCFLEGYCAPSGNGNIQLKATKKDIRFYIRTLPFVDPWKFWLFLIVTWITKRRRRSSVSTVKFSTDCQALCKNWQSVLWTEKHITRVPLCTAHNTPAILGHAATPPHNKWRRNLTECFNINITSARLNCKLSDDGRRPKHVAAI